MHTAELIRRYMFARSEARASRDIWVRTQDPIWLQISMIQRELAKKLHAEIMRRIKGFRTPRP